MLPHKFSLRSLFGSVFGGLCLALFVLFWLASGPASRAAANATTFYVDAATGNDSDTCLTPAAACATIEQAVNKAVNGDTIEIAAGTYHENNIEVFEQLTLHGAGSDQTIIDGSAAGRIFRTGSTVLISGVRIQNGQTTAGTIFNESGGAVLASGSLTLQNSMLVENHAAGSGGAIFNLGKLVLENTQVLSNTTLGGGGGIYNYNEGIITITQSTLAFNSATGTGAGGGAIYAGGKALTIRNSTLAGNTANYFGGALSITMNGPTILDGVTLAGNQAVGGGGFFSALGTITGTNLTLSGNIATNNYAGIYIAGAGANLFLQNSTIAYNTRTSSAGNGMNGLMTGSGAVVRMVNTILAYNQENNCSSFSPPTSLGHNLSDDFTCGLNQAGDLPGTLPLLGLLADYGGTIKTHALLPGSPAVDAGENTQCLSVDGRGIPRPYDGDGDSQAVCDIGAVEVRHQLLISNATITEGNSGSVMAVFNVTLAPPSTQIVTVNYATLNGTAIGGLDYTAASNTLTFNPGETQKTISISVTGDTQDELDETFLVQLSSAVNADLLNTSATGTIVDDDALPTLSIADKSVLEGNTGSTNLQFSVTLSLASSSAVTVTYATSNGTAAAGADFTTKNGTLIFLPGETSKSISVSVLGDVVDEGVSENFNVQLSSPVNATLADGQAVGTITDDDEARLSQTFGPRVVEGNSGFTPAVFTVTLSTPASFVIHVDYAASSGVGAAGAVVGIDFAPSTGTLTFQPGETVKTYTVQIIGDTLGEYDEDFSTLISNANVPINANGSSAKIINDDNFLIYLPLQFR